MASLTEAAVLDALRAIKDPDLHKDIVALGFVKNVRIDGGRVALTIELTTPACPVYWRSIWLLVRFQLRRILSLEPVISFLASAERAAATTLSGCVSTRDGPGGSAHNFRVPSAEDVRSCVLLG